MTRDLRYHLTRRTALLACLAPACAVVGTNPSLVAAQGLGWAQTPGQPNRLVIALGSQPYEIGSLEIRFNGKAKTFTSAELWDVL
jgi:hypothetical protein